MKITGISITDFLGIQTFKLDKAGKLNLVTGDNGVGKSSVLRAIKEAFKTGGRDANIVHKDAEKGEIFIQLDTGHTIRRRFDAARSQLDVTDGDRKIEKPQTFLDGLFGPNVFNPIDFFRADPRERRSMLLQTLDLRITKGNLYDILTGLGIDGSFHDFGNYDFDANALDVIAILQKDIYNSRALVNGDIIRIKKSIEQDRKELPDTFDAEKFADFNHDEKMAELKVAQETVSRYKNIVAEQERSRNRYNQIAAEIEEAERKLAALQAEAKAIHENGHELAAKVAGYEAPNIAAMEKNLSEYNASRKAQVKLEAIKQRETELVTVEESHERLDNLHKALVDAVPKAILKEAKVPIDGLEIRNDDLYVDGKEFGKLSQSEQIRFGVKLARFLSQDKPLKVILVDGIEALSTTTRKAFIAEAAGDEFEYFMTQVTDGPLNVETEAA